MRKLGLLRYWGPRRAKKIARQSVHVCVSYEITLVGHGLCGFGQLFLI